MVFTFVIKFFSKVKILRKLTRLSLLEVFPTKVYCFVYLLHEENLLTYLHLLNYGRVPTRANLMLQIWIYILINWNNINNIMYRILNCVDLMPSWVRAFVVLGTLSKLSKVNFVIIDDKIILRQFWYFKK